MSFIKRHRALSILGWFIALFSFNPALDWWQNADKSGLFMVLAAVARLLAPPELVLSVAAVYGIASKRQLMPIARLTAYVAVGLPNKIKADLWD